MSDVGALLARWAERDAAIGLAAELEQVRAQLRDRSAEVVDLARSCSRRAAGTTASPSSTPSATACSATVEALRRPSFATARTSPGARARPGVRAAGWRRTAVTVSVIVPSIGTSRRGRWRRAAPSSSTAIRSVFDTAGSIADRGDRRRRSRRCRRRRRSGCRRLDPPCSLVDLRRTVQLLGDDQPRCGACDAVSTCCSSTTTSR